MKPRPVLFHNDDQQCEVAREDSPRSFWPHSASAHKRSDPLLPAQALSWDLPSHLPWLILKLWEGAMVHRKQVCRKPRGALSKKLPLLQSRQPGAPCLRTSSCSASSHHHRGASSAVGQRKAHCTQGQQPKPALSSSGGAKAVLAGPNVHFFVFYLMPSPQEMFHAQDQSTLAPVGQYSCGSGSGSEHPR